MSERKSDDSRIRDVRFKCVPLTLDISLGPRRLIDTCE